MHQHLTINFQQFFVYSGEKVLSIPPEVHPTKGEERREGGFLEKMYVPTLLRIGEL
jgi:hypothetical protein